MALERHADGAREHGGHAWDRQNRHSIPGSGSSHCSAVAGDDEDDVTGAFGN